MNPSVVQTVINEDAEVDYSAIPLSTASAKLVVNDSVGFMMATKTTPRVNASDYTTSMAAFVPKHKQRNEDVIVGATALMANGTTWPVKHSAVMEGDVILGGLMMVHSREDSITCGPIMPQGGIQALEVMLYTLDSINAMGLLPNVTVGAHILDDCDKDTYGLEMAVDFIKGESCARNMYIYLVGGGVIRCAFVGGCVSIIIINANKDLVYYGFMKRLHKL